MALQFLRPSDTDPSKGVYRDLESGKERVYGLPRALRPKCNAKLYNGKPCFRRAVSGYATCRQCFRRAQALARVPAKV